MAPTKLPDTVKAGRVVAQLETKLVQAKYARDLFIQNRYAAGGVTLQNIADETGLSRQQVYNIVRRGRTTS